MTYADIVSVEEAVSWWQSEGAMDLGLDPVATVSTRCGGWLKMLLLAPPPRAWASSDLIKVNRVS